MNRKLLTLAVAAAVAAPTAAMAEAVLYGKLHVSIDYADVNNAVGVSYETVDTTNYVGVDGTDVGVGTIYPTAADAAAGTNPIGAINAGSFVNTTGEAVYWQDANGQVFELDANTYYATGETEDSIDLEDVTLIRVDANGIPIVNRASGQDYTGWGINGRSSQGFMPGASRANRVGVKGSEDLGNGLKAIYQVEFGVQLADTNANVASGSDNVTMRNSFVGLAGDWGTFLVGRHDTPLKISTGKLDLFADTMADYNGTVGFDDNRTDNTVAYISPSFSGFSFAGAIVAPGGTEFGGQNINADSLAEAYSLALIYNNGPWYASAAYESISSEMYMDSATSNDGSSACIDSAGQPTLACAYVDDDYTKWRIGLGILDWNGFTLTAVYEDQSDLANGQRRNVVGFVDPNGNVSFAGTTGVKDQKLWQVQAGYSFGNNMFKAMYGSVNRDSGKAFANFRDETLAINNISNLASGLRSDLEGDRSTWAVGFDHNFSKRTTAYVLYTAVDDDFDGVPSTSLQNNNGIDWSGFSLGMIHKF
jgi:predicted porin